MNQIYLGNSFNNIIDGGAGEDTYIINSTRNNFSITKISPTEFSITDPNGTDTIRNVEYIQFTDSTIRLFNELEALKYIAGNTDLITALGLAADVTYTQHGSLPGGNVQDALADLADQFFRQSATPSGDNVAEGDLWYNTSKSSCKA